jgi:hypothetical protein
MSEAANAQSDAFSTSMEAIGARLAEERCLRRLERRPANSLHVRPNLDHYRKQARRLQKENDLRLHEAQLAVARSVGFASWRKLIARIKARNRAADGLQEALLSHDHDAIGEIVREQPDSLLDAGSVASPDEMRLLLELVPLSRNDPDMLTELLDAVAEHHDPEGLGECVGMLLTLGADPFYANDTIEERWERAEASTQGAKSAEMFEDALGILAWYVDEPEDSYMTKDN